MMYKHTLEESKNHIQQLKEEYGYDNVFEIKIDVETDELDWIKLHLMTNVDHLKNGLEYFIEDEDYETADMILKIINFKKSNESELTLPLYRTQGKTNMMIRKK